MPPVLWLCWLGLITFFLKMKSCCLDSMMEPIIFICEQNEVGTMNLFLAWLEIRCHTIRKKVKLFVVFQFSRAYNVIFEPRGCVFTSTVFIFLWSIVYDTTAQ